MSIYEALSIADTDTYLEFFADYVSVNARAHIEASRKALQDSSLIRDPILDVALNQYPDQTAEVVQQVKSIVDDWRAGQVASLNQAFTEQLGLGALPDLYQLRCPPLGTDIATPTSFGRYPSQPHTAAGPLASVNELGLPLHRDPSDDMLDHDMSPPLGIMPVFQRGMMRPAMRPTKARILSRPGRGPMPLPISVHPHARPFGVAQSSLALREAAQLTAMDPTARQLVSRRHAPPRLEPLPKLEPCLPEGFEMPEKLPSPETAVTLLAQANRANDRYLKLSKQPQNASQYGPPAVLGADGATAGTAGDFIKDHPLINPRTKANPAAAPQAIAAPAAPVVAPKTAPSLPSQQLASPAQPVSSVTQAPPQAAPVPAAAPATTLPAGSVTPSTVATDPPLPANQPRSASTVAEALAAAVDNAEDDTAGLQNGKPIKQRLGQKQRKRQREIAEQKKVEDDARAAAEAERVRQAEAEAREVQAAEAKAKAAEKAAKAAEEAQQAEAKRAEEARAEQAAAAMRQAEAASFKAAEELLASEEAAVQGKKLKQLQLHPSCRCIA